MRGISHSVFGQAQADCGIVIDSSTLNRIHSIGPDGAVVDAGVKWSELLNAALRQGLAPKAGAWFTPPDAPNDDTLLADLSFLSSSTERRTSLRHQSAPFLTA